MSQLDMSDARFVLSQRNASTHEMTEPLGSEEPLPHDVMLGIGLPNDV
jgi:hypothetical protein